MDLCFAVKVTADGQAEVKVIAAKEYEAIDAWPYRFRSGEFSSVLTMDSQHKITLKVEGIQK